GGFKVSDFLLEHSDSALGYWGSYLSQPKVVGLIPLEEREPFVRMIYIRATGFIGRWIPEVIAVGVPLSTVAEMILEGLEAAPDDCEKVLGNKVWEFLSSLGSVSDVPTEWSVLTDAQFIRAIGICARKSPTRFLATRAQIVERIGQDKFNSFASEAAGRRRAPRDRRA